MNLLAPERQPRESLDDYRARRALARIAVAQKLAPSNPPRFIHRTVSRKRIKNHGAGQHPKPLAIRRRAQHKHPLRDALGAITMVGPLVSFEGGVPHDPRWFQFSGTSDGDWTGRRIWGAGRFAHDLAPNRERDAGKREKPKSAVAKRMDRPHRAELVSKGHDKLMRWFGAVKP